MAALTQTNTPSRHVAGNLVIRFYNLSGTNGDTFTVSAGTIRMVVPVATTAIAIGCTFTGNTITFVTSGAWSARVMVMSATG